MPENSLRGYTWFVRPGPGFPAGPRDVPWGGTPVPRFAWPIGPGERGVRNRYGNVAYVAVTETPCEGSTPVTRESSARFRGVPLSLRFTVVLMST